MNNIINKIIKKIKNIPIKGALISSAPIDKVISIYGQWLNEK